MNEIEDMSAELSLPLQTEQVHAPRSVAVQWLEGELPLPESFTLECGTTLPDAQLAWTCTGPANAPLIVVLGGISAHRRPCARDGRGWWEAQCGEGKAMDIERYRVLGIDWLGGCDSSTGPRHRAGDRFPEIATADQASAILLLLNRLGIRRVHLVVGASYGGNVAQQLAALLGERLRRLVLLSAAHRPAQFGLALRRVQRAILDLGDDDAAALALARSLAVLGYRTPESLEQRFAHPGEAGDADGRRNGVIGWIDHHGEKFARRFDAEAYRCLGRSLDAHAIDPSAIRVPTTLFAVREDLTVPLSLLREYATQAQQCELVEIDSVYGHDAFLKEETIVAGLLKQSVEAAQ